MKELTDFEISIFSAEFPVENELEKVQQLFSAGLKVFHFRRKGSTEKEVEVFLSEINPKYLSRIVLHQHFNLANQFKLKGIHLTKKQRKEGAIAGELYSTSVHSFRELNQLKKEFSTTFSAIYLSPIYSSISKPDYYSSFTKEELLEGLKFVSSVFALGGCTLSHQVELSKQGFVGMALLGAVWNCDFDLFLKEFTKET